MFDCLGTIDQREEIAMKYMKYFVDYVYESHCLYMNDDGSGYIGIEDSRKVKLLPELKFLWNTYTKTDSTQLRKLLVFSNEVSNSNALYASKPHLDVLFVCVKKEEQGKGKATELINYAKEMADVTHLPLILDTYHKEYAEIYEHLGCTCYNSVQTSSGIIRYNLVYK